MRQGVGGEILVEVDELAFAPTPKVRGKILRFYPEGIQQLPLSIGNPILCSCEGACLWVGFEHAFWLFTFPHGMALLFQGEFLSRSRLPLSHLPYRMVGVIRIVNSGNGSPL